MEATARPESNARILSFFIFAPFAGTAPDNSRNQPVVFETGATTAVVNELVLYTNQTAALAERRDWIFETHHEAESGIEALEEALKDLYYAAVTRYKREFPNGHDHLKHLMASHMWEYLSIYAADFEKWKR